MLHRNLTRLSHVLTLCLIPKFLSAKFDWDWGFSYLFSLSRKVGTLILQARSVDGSISLHVRCVGAEALSLTAKSTDDAFSLHAKSANGILRVKNEDSRSFSKVDEVVVYPYVAAATFFPKFWKILDPPFDFNLLEFIWFLELCFFPLLQIWIFLSLNWGKLFPSFWKLDDLNFPLSSQSFWLWSLFIF